MSVHENRHHSGRGIFPIAGWLFADLFLALTIIFIATSIPEHAITKQNIRRITPTPMATIKPTPQLVQALSTHSLQFSVFADPLQLNDPATIASVKDKVRQELDANNDSHRKVGFVITLAGGNDGEAHSAKFNAILRSMPSFHDAVTKDYHYLGHAESEFDLDIYFFVDV